jgi:dTMP kinase
MAEPTPGPGHLVAVEGIDGSGKTTVAQRLCDHLRARETLVFETREPTDAYTGTAVREAIRDPEHDPMSEALLFAADHAGHVATIRQALADGAVVVSDRYSISWRAYQSVTLEDVLEDEPAGWLEGVLEPFELTPDLVLLLDLPVERALERVEARDVGPAKFEAEAFLKEVRGRYLTLARERGYERIDASGSPDEVFEACRERVEGLVDGGSG